MELGNANKNKLGLKNKNDKYNNIMHILEDENSSHAKIIKYIGNNTNVLDLGCSNGLIGEYIVKNKNCKVTGCDISTSELTIAKKRKCYEELINIDLDTAVELGSGIKKGTFDYAIFSDVLEHLINPEKAINLACKYLKDNGKIIVCVPNIAHSDIIINLMNGKFNYSEVGILDNTHLRFFTKNSFIDFINNFNENNNQYNLKCTIHDKVIVDDIENIKNNKEFLRLFDNDDMNVLQNIFVLEKNIKNDNLIINKYLEVDNNFYNNFERLKYQNFETINYEKNKNSILNKENRELIIENKNLEYIINDLKNEMNFINENYNHKIYKIATLLKMIFLKIIPYNSFRYNIVKSIYHIFKFIVMKTIKILKLILKYILPKKLKYKIIKNLGYHSKICSLIGFESYKNYKKEILNVNGKDEIILQKFLINKSIAVHLHLYYIDLADEFIMYLKNIPYSFDLYISVPNKKNVRPIRKKFKKILNAKAIIVKVSENSGRDFGPMFVLFGNELKKYDYLLHIHSKKSLRMGNSQDEWRHYLLNSLLFSRYRVTNIISLMENYNIGMVYQDTFKTQPYWGHTWLGSSHIARDICHKIGIKFDDKYLDFSAGSMFFCKTESIKQLFDLNLSWKDFGEEQNFDDGTLAYVMERIMIELVKNNKFDYAVYNEKEGKFLLNNQIKNLDDYTKNDKKNSTDFLKTFNIISFDIFDTLITRKIFEPDDLYYLIESKINKNIKFNDTFINIRKNAENIARNKLNKDVNIYEIYDEVKNLTQLKEEEVVQIMNLEIELEYELCIPRYDMLDIYNELLKNNKQIVLVSDMYLPKDIIAKILEKCGYKNWFDLLVSCEVNKRKDSGTMWDFYYKKYGKSKTIHIGDNEESDIHKLCCLNKNCFHVMNPKKMYMLSNYYYGDKLNIDEKFILGLIFNKGIYNSPFGLKEKIDLKKFGYSVLGPIFLQFTLWLNKISKDYDEILFFSREGYYLQKIYNLINNEKKSKYFYISRRAITVANIFEERDILNILNTFYKGSLKNLFLNRLGIYIYDEIDIEIELPRDISLVKEYIKKYSHNILENAKYERKNYLNYIKNTIDINKKILAVDLGYSGTAQYELSKFLNKKIDGAYFVVSDNLKPLSLGCKVFSCFNDIIYDESFSNNPIGKYSLFLEAFLTSPDGQLISFDEYGIPNFLYEGKKNMEYFDIIFEEISEFIKDYSLLNTKDLEDINCSNKLIYSIFENFIKNGLFDEKLLKICKVEDLYCSNEIINAFDFINKKE